MDKNALKKRFTVKESCGGVKIVCKDAFKRTFQALSAMRTDGTLCDIKIKTADGEVSAHKVVLAACSDYFRAMFDSGMIETRNSEVSLLEYEFHILSKLVDYIYLGHIEVTADQLPRLVQLADMVQMTELRDICLYQLETQVAPSNCLGLFAFGEQLNCQSLVTKCKQMICQRFQAVCLGDEWVALSPETLCHLLSMQNLSLGSSGEDVMAEAVLSWLNHNVQQLHYDPTLTCSSQSMNQLSDTAEKISTTNVENDNTSEGHGIGERVSGFDTGVTEKLTDMSEWSQVLKCVQWNEVSSPCFTKIVSSNTVSKHSGITEKLNELRASNVSISRRTCAGNVYVIGGFLQSRTGPLCPRVQSVECYNIRTETWSSLQPLPVLPSYVYTFCVGQQIVCITMVTTTNRTQMHSEQWDTLMCFTYSTVHDMWADLSECIHDNVKRHLLTCIQDGGAIYCNDTVMYSVSFRRVLRYEIAYCAENDSLSITSPNDLPLVDPDSELQYSGHCMLECNGQLYCMGGAEVASQRDMFVLPRLCRLDDNQQRWLPLADMSTPRVHFGAVELGGQIFVMGGYDGARRSKSLECYNPDSDAWVTLQDMNHYRTHFGVTVMDGKIMVVGGKSYSFGEGGARKVLKACETYDPLRCNEGWKVLPPMSQSRCMLGVITI